MKRLAVLLSVGWLSASACSAAAKLGLSSSSSTSAGGPSVSSSSPGGSGHSIGEPAGGLSEYATRFIRDTNALSQSCPAGPTPAPNYESECIWRMDASERLYKSVEEKSNGQVERGRVYLADLHKSVEQWRAGDKAAENRKVADYKLEQAAKDSARNAESLLRQFKDVRDGKITSKLISFENRDAEYVKYALERLQKLMPELADLAKACAAGAGEKDECELAINRDKYWPKLLVMQFDAILAERLEAWTNTIDGVKHDGQVAVINYNRLMKPAELAGLGKDLADIGAVLSQPNPKAKIDGKLAKIRDDFAAAVKEKSTVNQWALHATDAKYHDPAIMQATKAIDGLQTIKVGSTSQTWEVIRGAHDNPVQRNHYIWALMKKPGDGFCRLYQFTVVEQHLGGGRYGAPRADSFGAPEFFVSACK